MYPYPHIHLWYALLAVIFVAIISYMLFYGKRSKDHEKKLEQQGHTHFDSKEMGILEAQDAMKQERREHHRH